MKKHREDLEKFVIDKEYYCVQVYLLEVKEKFQVNF